MNKLTVEDLSLIRVALYEYQRAQKKDLSLAKAYDLDFAADIIARLDDIASVDAKVLNAQVELLVS